MPHPPGAAHTARSGLQRRPISSLSVQDINISLWRLPEKVKFDKSVFMNQGEWELLGVLTQFREFSIESSSCYAEMKFYVSGTGAPATVRPQLARADGRRLREGPNSRLPRMSWASGCRNSSQTERGVCPYPSLAMRVQGPVKPEGRGSGGVPGCRALCAPACPQSSSPGPRWSSAGGPSSMLSACCCPASSSWSWTSWASTCPRTVGRGSPSRSRSSWATLSF